MTTTEVKGETVLLKFQKRSGAGICGTAIAIFLGLALFALFG